MSDRIKIIVLFSTLVFAIPLVGQRPTAIRIGTKVPADVKRIYERGLNYLAQNQDETGNWGGQRSSSHQNGIISLCLLALVASGEDPNHGRYQVQVGRATRLLLMAQDVDTGYFGSSMYNHGFSMLALAELYGAVDDDLLWSKIPKEKRGHSIGKALELAVRCALTSQDQNPYGAWRYSPEAKDADTSVAGAVLVGLLAAKNAGIEVPDKNIERAFDYFTGMTTETGYVNYSGPSMFGDSIARSSVTTLILSIGKRKDSKEYEQAAKYLRDNINSPISGSWKLYTPYYMAQALFQSNYDAWKKWNDTRVALVKRKQNDDGSFDGTYGKAYGTSMSLLALALNYRFLPIYER
ncbi:MAG: hypothetical protein OSA95_14000 [Opitutales bacterium]|nr:hypothetical protein [Opitutales bacterium]